MDSFKVARVKTTTMSGMAKEHHSRCQKQPRQRPGGWNQQPWEGSNVLDPDRVGPELPELTRSHPATPHPLQQCLQQVSGQRRSLLWLVTQLRSVRSRNAWKHRIRPSLAHPMPISQLGRCRHRAQPHLPEDPGHLICSTCSPQCGHQLPQAGQHPVGTGVPQENAGIY